MSLLQQLSVSIRGDSGGFQNAIKSAEKAATAFEKRMSRINKIKDGDKAVQAAGIEGLKALYDKNTAAAHKYSRAMAVVQTAYKANAITLTEYKRVEKQITNDYINSAAKFSQGSDSMTMGVNQVRGAIDKNYAAMLKYKEGASTLNAAMNAGKLSIDQYSLAMGQLKLHYDVAGKEANEMANKSRTAIDNLRNSLYRGHTAAQRYRKGMATVKEAAQLGTISLNQKADMVLRLKNEWEKAKNSMRKSSVVTLESIKSLRASVDSAYANTIKYKEGVNQLNAALKSNIITLKQKKDIKKKLALQYGINKTKAVESASSIKTSYSSLKSSIDLVYAAQQTLNKGTKTIQNAFRSGIISAKEYAASLSAVRAQYAASTRNVQTNNRALRANRFATGNIASQFNDIGVMMASGQNPFTLAIQQGTQISQVLNMMGGGRSIIQGLGQAFKTFISPVSIATVAVVYLGAKLVQLGIKALKGEDGLRKLKHVLKDYKNEVKDLNKELYKLEHGIESSVISEMSQEIKKNEKALASLADEYANQYKSRLEEGWNPDNLNSSYGFATKIIKKMNKLESKNEGLREKVKLHEQATAEVEKQKAIQEKMNSVTQSNNSVVKNLLKSIEDKKYKAQKGDEDGYLDKASHAAARQLYNIEEERKRLLEEIRNLKVIHHTEDDRILSKYQDQVKELNIKGALIQKLITENEEGALLEKQRTEEQKAQTAELEKQKKLEKEKNAILEKLLKKNEDLKSSILYERGGFNSLMGAEAFRELSKVEGAVDAFKSNQSGAPAFATPAGQGRNTMLENLMPNASSMDPVLDKLDQWREGLTSGIREHSELTGTLKTIEDINGSLEKHYYNQNTEYRHLNAGALAYLHTVKQTDENLKRWGGYIDQTITSLDRFASAQAAFNSEYNKNLIELDKRANKDATSTITILRREKEQIELETIRLRNTMAADKEEAAIVAAKIADGELKVAKLKKQMVILAQQNAALNPIKPKEENKPAGRNVQSEQDKLRQQIEAIRVSTLTKLELEQERYAKEQALLEQAEEQKLLTHKKYEDLIAKSREKHHRNLENINVYYGKNAVAQTAAFMGDMANAFAQGGDKYLKQVQILGAVEALINSWRAYTQVIADPTLPWFAKIPAAIGVFTSAIGAYNAIKGANTKSSGGASSPGGAGGGGGGGSPGGNAAGAGAGGGADRTYNLTLIGDNFNRQQAIQIAEFMNEESNDGLNLVIAGRTG